MSTETSGIHGKMSTAWRAHTVRIDPLKFFLGEKDTCICDRFSKSSLHLPVFLDYVLYKSRVLIRYVHMSAKLNVNLGKLRSQFSLSLVLRS